MNRVRRPSRLVAAAGLVLALSGVGASPVFAQTGERIEVEVVGGGPIFDFSQIHPGATLTSVLQTTNVGPDPGELSVTAVDIVDESRCSDAEVRMEMACGSGRGHLGDQVQFSIDAVSAGDDLQQVWTGTLEEMADVELSASLAPEESAEYRFSAHLPASSGNETQSDLLGFDLRFELVGADADTGAADTGVADETAVLGASTDRAQTASLFGMTLPRTGDELARWGFIAGAALLAGSVLLLLSQFVRVHGGATRLRAIAATEGETDVTSAPT